MRLVTYHSPEKDGELRPGLLLQGSVADIPRAMEWARRRGILKGALDRAPASIMEILESREAMADNLAVLQAYLMEAEGQSIDLEGEPLFHAAKSLRLAAPLPRPTSLRDFYAFEAHAKMAWARRNRGVPEEWYKFPVFYFGNHNATLGPDEPIRRPPTTQALDYELEVACVIGKKGIDVKREEAQAYIAGYTIMNDWSARDIQAQEMRVRIGQAKGKDFANSIGPYIATPDEIEDKRDGERYDLVMEASVNGELYSRGNYKDIYWSFPQMIEHASRDAALYPGDILGSGTVGTGCLLELGREWLKPGDIVELSVERLGRLRNTVI